MKTVADQLVEFLAAAGVKRIYGLVGDSLNGLTDALRRQDKIAWVHVRHEEVAAFAAGAEAQMTGALAVCAGSCGPGNMHLINGLYDCHRNGVPVLAVAAQIPTSEIGSGYFQETRPDVLFRDCSHYCEVVASPAQLPRMLTTAIRAANGQRGVSVLVISGDTALLPAESATIPPAQTLVPPRPVTRPDDAGLDALAAMLNDANEVTLLCGAGCEGAHAQLLALGAALQSPMVHALRGKEHVEWDNAYDVGMTGLIGFSSGYHAMRDCSMLLMLGTDFPYRQFFPDGKTKIAQLDIKPGHLGRRTHIDLGLVGDVAATIDALLPRLHAKSDSAHLQAAKRHYAEARKSLDDEARENPGGRVIHPQQVTAAISKLAAEDAVFTCDVGLPTVWAARYLHMNGKRRLIGSFLHGSMANAMPQAIGVQSAFPDRQVISLSGDGGFAMLMGDVLTLVQQKLPVKLVIYNNSSLGFVELEQKSSGFVDTGTGLQNPNFAKLAEAVGIRGIRLEHPEDVEPGIAAALAHDGPVLVDAVVNRMELAVPPKISAEMAKGFTLYMAKAVLDGRGGDLIELARTNLKR